MLQHGWNLKTFSYRKKPDPNNTYCRIAFVWHIQDIPGYKTKSSLVTAKAGEMKECWMPEKKKKKKLSISFGRDENINILELEYDDGTESWDFEQFYTRKGWHSGVWIIFQQSFYLRTLLQETIFGRKTTKLPGICTVRTEWRNALLQGILWVESWEMQTKPESSNSIWRALWNHILWEVTGRSAGIGQLNEPSVITGQEREKDVTGAVVPGFSLDTTEVVLMRHTNCGQTTPQQRWQTQVWSHGYPPWFHPFLLFLWLWMGH